MFFFGAAYSLCLFVAFKIINPKIDFNDRGDMAVRYSERFVPTIPMRVGKYSDTGHRFRYNHFIRQDYWVRTEQIINPFFDYVLFNSDTFDVDVDQVVIAEIYFRLETDQINHEREVFNFMDFIGTIGGIG